MVTRTALLVRIPSTLLLVICLLAPVGAQHGGGGGHFGGGHSGGGHSSGRQSDRSKHFGWLHFGFRKHSGRQEAIEARPASYSLPPTSDLLDPMSARVASMARIPPTLLWSPPLFSRRRDEQFSGVDYPVHTRGSSFNRFRRFPSSGCLLNGVTQVCFFAPFFPLFSCYGDFDPFYSGYSLGPGDDLDSTQGPVLPEMPVMPPAADPADEDITEGNSSTHPGAPLVPTTEDRVDKGVFLLVLSNGSSHAVTDYWVADGYLEYISPNGTRSHVPLDALDLQSTVVQNAPRGLPFVLRFAPAQNR